MNKLLSLVIFLAMTGIVTAKDIINEPLPNSIKNNIEVRNESKYITNKKDAETQARGNRINVNNHDVLLEYNSFQHQLPANIPIAYDPSTNLIAITMADFLFVKNSFAGTTLWQLRTTDNGKTWDSLYTLGTSNEANAFASYRSSIAFTNPSKSPNADDVNYVIASRAQDIKPSIGPDGISFIFYSPEFGGTIVQRSNAPLLGGNINDPQEWGILKLYGDDDLNKVFGYGALTPTSKNSQYGYFGFYSIDFGTSEEISNNPEEWWHKHFRPSTSKEGSFVPPVSIGNDKEGNLYNVADHFFADDDQGRYISFSKSTDEGKNWTSYNRMPRSLYNDFISNYDGYAVWSSAAYQQNSLFVRGVDDFSFITNLLILDKASQPTLSRAFLMDMRYNNGTWSMKPIQELNELGTPTFTLRTDTTEPWLNKYDMNSATTNSFGNNIKMSRTADGNKLILYWIDVVPESFKVFPPYEVVQSVTDPASGVASDQLVPIDSIQVTDIFAKVYDIESDTWGPTKNLTNDSRLEFMYNVPYTVKSTKEAILLTYHADTSRSFTVTPNAPKEFYELYMGSQSNFPMYLSSDVFDIDNLTSVETESTLKFNVELGDAFPNPAINTNTVSISFEVEKLSNVTVELYDQIGNKISTLYNNQSTAGYKAFNADISNLNSGAYYYQLNVNGFTFTKKLVVVK